MFSNTAYPSSLFGISIILIVVSLKTENKRDMLVSMSLFTVSIAWFIVDVFASGPIG